MRGMTRPRRRWGVAVFCGALLTVTVSAQDRRPLVGRVVDAAGKPLPGADVTLVHTPYGVSAGERVDLVVAVSDARGYFVVKLLPQQLYSAWAVHRAEDGDTRVSGLLEDVASGGNPELQVRQRVVAHTLVCEGLAAWAAVAPLRLEIAPASVHAIRVPVGPAGELPPLPAERIAYAVDARGGVVAQQRLAVGLAAPPFELPPPVRRRLQVRDASGRPVVGAEVHHVVANPVGLAGAGLFDREPLPQDRIVATTDANGVADCIVPQPRIQDLVLEVRQPSFATALILEPPSGEVFVVDRRRPGCGEDAMPVVLQPSATLQVLRGVTPVAGATLRLVAVFTAGAYSERSASLRTDDIGMVPVPLRNDPAQAMVQISANADTPEAFVRVPWSAGVVSKLHLSSLRRLRLQVLDESGGPAAGLAGCIVPVGGVQAPKLRALLSTDQAGRCERLLGGDPWLLLFADGQRWVRVDVPGQQAGGPADLELTVQCQAMASGRLRFVDGNGKPVAGASIQNLAIGRSETWRAGDLAQQVWFQLVPEVGARIARRAVSGADGALQIPLLDVAGSQWWALNAAWQGARVELLNGVEATVVVR